jgi:hypothetical protein
MPIENENVQDFWRSGEDGEYFLSGIRERESNLTPDETRDGKTEFESWGGNRSMTLSSGLLCFAGARFSDFISF